MALPPDLVEDGRERVRGSGATDAVSTIEDIERHAADPDLGGRPLVGSNLVRERRRATTTEASAGQGRPRSRSRSVRPGRRSTGHRQSWPGTGGRRDRRRRRARSRAGPGDGRRRCCRGVGRPGSRGQLRGHGDESLLTRLDGLGLTAVLRREHLGHGQHAPGLGVRVELERAIRDGDRCAWGRRPGPVRSGPGRHSTRGRRGRSRSRPEADQGPAWMARIAGLLTRSIVVAVG